MKESKKLKWKKKCHEAGQNALDILFPPHCPVCAGILKRRERICKSCSEKITLLKEPVCRKCGKKVLPMEEYCFDCQRHGHEFERGVAVFEYDDLISHSIYRYKYKNKQEYARFYGQEMCKLHADTFRDWQIEAVIPVPLYKKKKQLRGYNQAEILAKEVAFYLDLPLIKDGLLRIRSTKAQKELNHMERRKNLEHAFEWNSKKQMRWKRVLLIDDIYTTGSTIDTCASALKNAGCTEVYFAALSIGRGV